MENKSEKSSNPYIPLNYFSYLGNGLVRTDCSVCIPTACLPYGNKTIEINNKEEITTKEEHTKHVEENTKEEI
jgi:hypothetical protein